MAHVHYANYTNSHWYSGSPTDGPGIWIRDPVIDGYTPLDDALELLDQARKETQAIENALGTAVSGSAATLLDKLALRMSPEGHHRGLVRPLRAANTAGSAKNEVTNWWNWGSNYIQLGRSGTFSNLGNVVVTFHAPYFSGLIPRVIVCKLVGPANETRVGAAQLRVNQVDENAFQASVRGWSTSNNWGTIDWTFRIMYLAYGGFPAT